MEVAKSKLMKMYVALKCEKGGYKEMCEVAEKIYDQGIERGKEQGKMENAKAMAISLHESGVSDDLRIHGVRHL